MILVTGATGHIGSRLVEALLKHNEKVRILATEDHCDIKNVEVVHGNLLDIDSLKIALDKVDVIYHLAAIVDYGPAPRDMVYEVNVNGTKNMLEISKAKKFIYLSTTSVYGKHMKENPATEKTPYHPENFYGETKMIAEKMVIEKHGIVLRSPVIYGPGFNEGFGVVVSQIEKGKMRIVGKGDNPIQWIHISDLIQALVLAKDKGMPGEVYLVAGGEAKTQEELFGLLAKYLKVAPPSKRVSKLLANTMTYYMMLKSKATGKKPKLLPEHIQRITSNKLFDITKAKRELGFRPLVGYEQGAKEIVEEHLAKSS
jgi:nucleoside-diphosphate-sugar epimerase